MLSRMISGGIPTGSGSKNPAPSPRSNNTRQAEKTDLHPVTLPSVPSSLAGLPCSPAPPLVVVADGQHQGDEAAQHQGAHLHPAQSFAAIACRGTVAVAASPDLGQHVDGGHVQEGAGGEEHGHAGGVDVRERLLAALKGGGGRGGERNACV